MKNDSIQWQTKGIKLPSLICCIAVLVAWLPLAGQAQVSSGSDGSDGALDFSAYAEEGRADIQLICEERIMTIETVEVGEIECRGETELAGG